LRGTLTTWLLIGVVIAGLVAGGTIGGLMLWGPHRAPRTTEVATVAPPSTTSTKVPGPSAGKSTIVEDRLPSETEPLAPSSQEPLTSDVVAEAVQPSQPTPEAAAQATGSIPNRDFVILQIGDSHTAADLFTGEVRDRLQAKFGAGGLFLPPGIPKAGVQSAEITIRADDAWQYKAMASTDEPNHFYLSGYTATASAEGAKITFTAKTQQAFDAIDVSFLKTNGGGQASILLDGNVVDQVSLDGRPGDPLIRRLMPQGGTVGAFKTLEVVTTSGGPVEFSGVFVDQRQSGVSYLSVGFPGARATVLQRMSPTNLTDDMSRIDPDMVVLAFGTNEGFDDNLDVDDYKKRLLDIIKTLKAGNGDMRFVIIGPPPGARKQDSCTDVHNACGSPPINGACWAQPPKLDAVRDAERDVAAQVGALFWDWSSVLPTACALEQGHLGDPAIFGPDRVHMTGKGYRDSADAFANVLVPLVGRLMGS